MPTLAEMVKQLAHTQEPSFPSIKPRFTQLPLKLKFEDSSTGLGKKTGYYNPETVGNLTFAALAEGVEPKYLIGTALQESRLGEARPKGGVSGMMSLSHFMEPLYADIALEQRKGKLPPINAGYLVAARHLKEGFNEYPQDITAALQHYQGEGKFNPRQYVMMRRKSGDKLPISPYFGTMKTIDAKKLKPHGKRVLELSNAVEESEDFANAIKFFTDLYKKRKLF